MEQKTHWNLRKMYPTDECWQEKLASVMRLVETLTAQKGHCADTAEALCQTARLYTQIDEQLYDLLVFANSNFDQDMSNPQAKKLYETAQNAAKKCST